MDRAGSGERSLGPDAKLERRIEMSEVKQEKQESKQDMVSQRIDLLTQQVELLMKQNQALMAQLGVAAGPDSVGAAKGLNASLEELVAKSGMTFRKTQGKMVKVRILRPTLVHGKIVEPIHYKEPGSKPSFPIVEISEEEAVELCDKKYIGHYAFQGGRMGKGSDDRFVVVKAERVA